ncbi:lipase chaperone LimK [Variovorax sp. 54]|uniref:lipase secretion chaperone n=1 Tax=Variovorax sp. 54 TaxID=2035212 RepID=UPI000C1997F6|nr:lipase secretion chaperone [Variovorax sp. 54]PIF76083.1 lipase chaperone LimK [Variovorax sp. 54]
MRGVALTLGAVALVAVGTGWLALGPDAGDAPRAAAPAAATATAAPSPAPRPASTAAAPDALLTSDLITLFDQVLAEAQADSKATLMARAPALLAKHLREDWRVRALGLLERYVDMQEALRTLQPPAPGDPAFLRRSLEAREVVRRQFFAPEEIEGLFGDQIRQDQFMAEKMELLSNPGLTPEQRAAALAQSEQAWLSPAQREVRKDAVAHLDVMRQTEALQARGASPQERFAARSEAYGYEVARGLATLDQETQEWNARLDRYASAPEAERAQLRETLFNENERLRLSGALAMRSSTAPKPAQ